MKDIIVHCGCGSTRKKCRVEEIVIDPEQGEVMIEILGEHDVLMYLDRKGAKALIRAGQQFLKANPLPR